MNSFDEYKKTVESQQAPPELIERTIAAMKKQQALPEKKRRVLWRPVAIAACAVLIVAISISLFWQNQFSAIPFAEMEAESAGQEGSAPEDSLSFGAAGILRKSWTPEQFAEATGVTVQDVLDGYRLESGDITAFYNESLEVTSVRAALAFAGDGGEAELTLEYNAAAGNKYHAGEPYAIDGTDVYFSEDPTENMHYAWFDRDGIEWLVSARGLDGEAFAAAIEKILQQI